MELYVIKDFSGVTRYLNENHIIEIVDYGEKGCRIFINRHDDNGKSRQISTPMLIHEVLSSMR